MKTLEQLALEVALKERERRLEEVKQAKSQKPEVDPNGPGLSRESTLGWLILSIG